VELGDTAQHTLHFMLSLERHGHARLQRQADTPLYAVFKRADGSRTYLAFNAGKAPLTVRFSDGKRLTVAPGALARLSGALTGAPGLRVSQGPNGLVNPGPPHAYF
jgi:hypothetical protein